MSEKKTPPKKPRTAKTTKPVKEKIVLYTQEQTDFVRFYIEQRLQNAGEAYQRAYPNCKSEAGAYSSASALLRTPKIQALLKKSLEIAMGDLKDNLDYKLIRMWVTRANYDVAEILNDDGSLVRPMTELKRLGLSICIDGVDISVDKEGNEHVSYKLANRDKSQDQLQKYIGLIKPLPTVNLNLNKDAADMTPEEEAEYQANLRTAFPGIDQRR